MTCFVQSVGWQGKGETETERDTDRHTEKGGGRVWAVQSFIEDTIN